MEAAAAGATTGALLLVLAGLAKVRRPDGAARALAQLGWPSSSRLVRAGAVAEVLVGATALVLGGPVPTALVALSYVGFTAFLLRAMAAGTAVSTCGCLGREDTPPTVPHLMVTTAVAATSAAVAVGGAGAGLPWVLEGGAVRAAALVAGLAVTTWLAVAALTLLPQVRVAR